MRKRRRALISLRIGAAIMPSFSPKVSEAKNACASMTDRSEASAMDLPPTVTARISGRRRLPRQSRAGRLAHQTVVIGFGGVALRFGGASLRGGNDAFKRRGEGVRIAVGARVVDVQRLAPAAVENHIQRFFGKPVQRRIHRKAVFLAQRLKEHTRLRAGLKVAPSHDVEGVFVQALAPVRHNQVGIDLLQHAQPRARRHAPNGLLKEKERGASSSMEMPHSGRRGFGKRAFRSRPVRISAMTMPPERESAVSSESVRRARISSRRNQAVYDDLDVVLFLFGQRGRFRCVAGFSVDPDADKARLTTFSRILTCSPFLPRTIGASSCMRVRSGRASSRSTI